MTKPETSCDTTIVSAAIYPPIGVMRVGNSPNEFFIGPEVDTINTQVLDEHGDIGKRDAAFYRDDKGRLKRQAARFRIYGLNAQGQAVKELTMHNASIEWTARLANQKASWYDFEQALDIPESAHVVCQLRNKHIKGNKRQGLLIDGGKHRLNTHNLKKKHCKSKVFEGEFIIKESTDDEAEKKRTKVYLGEMRTDTEGRLIMLGGHGVSSNPFNKAAYDFGNNDNWFDDMSDGPISAEVTYEGSNLPVAPAWVVCAPPDYAPLQKSVRTMYDLMRDVAVNANLLPRPTRPSFAKDILPIFQRMTDLQWVNRGFLAGFGWESHLDFSDDAWIKRLRDKSETWKASRRILANNFRRIDTQFTHQEPHQVQTWNPAPSANAPQLWPWLYGDAMDIEAKDSPRQFNTLTSLQLRFLDQWVEGDFDDDYLEKKPPITIEDLDVSEQPAMLIKAAMDFCLADAFHPGCEMTWPMRDPRMYTHAFRLKHAENTAPVHGVNFGPVMNQQIIQQADGPLSIGQVAGGLTRWMAIPWQTDTASCRDGYNRAYDPYLPTFWPATVPNQILNQQEYAVIVDDNSTPTERQQAFNSRQEWLDDLPVSKHADYLDQVNSMVKHFDNLAIVFPAGNKKSNDFPKQLLVGHLPEKSSKKHKRSAVTEAIRHSLMHSRKAQCIR